MSSKYSFFVSTILDCLDLSVPLYPLESVYGFAKRKRIKDLKRKKYLELVWQMRRVGYLKIVEKNNQKFLQITRKGQLENLLLKAGVSKTDKWDKKWRVLIFDIPEGSHQRRDHFRLLLKKNGFVKLQSSVFISPFPLNRHAIEYLNETGLNEFIRIMRVDEMDDDTALRKHFGLISSRP